MERAQERGRQNCLEISKEEEISSGWRDPFRPEREGECERGLDKTSSRMGREEARGRCGRAFCVAGVQGELRWYPPQESV